MKRLRDDIEDAVYGTGGVGLGYAGALGYGGDEVGLILRTLISAIALEPNGDELAIRLKGDLGGILALSAEPKKSKRPSRLSPEDLEQFEVVAGAGFEPATFRL